MVLTTFETDLLRSDLAGQQLLPEIVQVGNQNNPTILTGEELVRPIDWDSATFFDQDYKANKAMEFYKH